jgi:GNAT superfamily N-acetyltransferase
LAITFQEEPFAVAYADALAAGCLERHYAEIAENKDTIGPVDPDLDVYDRLDAAGRLHVLTARDGSRLVGYFVGVTGPSMHYRTVVGGHEDMYWLAPEYRRGAAGVRLVIEAEKMLRRKGARVATMRVKLARDHGPVLERLGFRPFERVHIKVLE